MEISLSRPTDFHALGDRWRALEARTACSFFQSWTWTGCLAEERFSDPVLLEASVAGETVALALFNRRRGLRDTLWLGESGDKTLDSPFIEHNGLLLASDTPPDVTVACLRAARRAPIDRAHPWLSRRLMLSGVDDRTLTAARRLGAVRLRRSLPAPFVDLARMRREGRDYLDGLSANTRYQLRRSDREYAAAGPLTVRRAATAAEAHAWLDDLATLHQATWVRRGAAGAFGNPFFGRFQHRLIDRGFGRGEIDVLLVSAGERCVGYLYNFQFRGRVMAYQSGFAYADLDPHLKPGLTSHHQVIRFCSGFGRDSYDFLAGDDRYKLSLAGGRTPLHWLEVGSGGSPAAALRAVFLALRGGDGRLGRRSGGPERPGVREFYTCLNRGQSSMVKLLMK
ncbi:MAG TPA: GNAT family N-acetyltransferase [Acetobacteraceae bacterium]|jgi:CelD/BcsL family acetyltransferase involved in cellulose biosynthesis